MAETPDNLLLFTPHIPRRANTTGWTAERQRSLIAALARDVIRAAAESAGMSARSGSSRIDAQPASRVRARESKEYRMLFIIGWAAFWIAAGATAVVIWTGP